MAGQTSNMDQFEAYFQRADVDRDGRISGNEAVAFLQASNLPRQVLAQIWMYADQNKVGYLGRSEFYNCLKLVTVAQSKQELTPDIVKAALYGPASTKIPPPRIGPQATPNAGPSPDQLSGNPHTTQGISVSAPHGFLTQQSQIARPPRPPPPNFGFQSQPGFQAQGIPGAGSTVASRPPNSFDSLGGTTDGSQARLSSQVSNRNLIPSSTQGDIGLLAPSLSQPKAPETAGLVQSASSPDDVSQVGRDDTRSPSATGNAFAANSEFGDVFSATPSKPHTPGAVTSPAANISAFSTGNLTSSGEQPTVKPSVVSQPSAIQAGQFQSMGKASQRVPAQKSAAFEKSQPPWPKMTQSDIQKYRKVFVQVDNDRDGKITGEQARNLFFSWRLPREVLKQVWSILYKRHFFSSIPSPSRRELTFLLFKSFPFMPRALFHYAETPRSHCNVILSPRRVYRFHFINWASLRDSSEILFTSSSSSPLPSVTCRLDAPTYSIPYRTKEVEEVCFDFFGGCGCDCSWI